MNAFIGVSTLLILLPLTLLVLYQWLLAGASFFYRAPKGTSVGIARTRFLVLIPAHNEEVSIANTLESLRNLDYPSDCYQVLVVADRCTDATTAIARSWNAQCLERSDGQEGKGAAIAWGIQKAREAYAAFDAIVIIDADTLADRQLLSAFDEGFQAGHHVQQGYNYISNPWASPFTRIMAVTGVLRNGRYYAGKSAIGLQGMLTGTGMCFGAKVIEHYGWTAFSVGEDWEFSVELLLGGENVYFNPLAKTFAKESQKLKQASRQRLRWASGRYAMWTKVWPLVRQGVRTGSLSLIDSAATLIAPNYSSQASLAILCVAASWVNSGDPAWGFTFYWAATLLMAIASYFVLGVFSTEAPAKALAGLLLVPVFLPWRLTIELLGMLGYGRRHWERRSRGATSSHQANR